MTEAPISQNSATGCGELYVIYYQPPGDMYAEYIMLQRIHVSCTRSWRDAWKVHQASPSWQGLTCALATSGLPVHPICCWLLSLHVFLSNSESLLS